MSMLKDFSPRIHLLGRFQVTRDNRELHDSNWQRRKASTLLQCLALERHLTKDQAIELLWPEASLTAGSNNLYPTLHALRQTLDSALGPGTAEATFSFKDGRLSLADSVWIDAHEFRRTAQRALSVSPPDQAELEAAIDLYGGDLLPGKLYDDWTVYVRDELRRLYREVSLALAGLKKDRGDYPRAISLLSPLLEHDLSDEFVHRELMRTYVQAGRRHDALRQYQLCVNALDDELGVSPDTETTALYHQLLSGELTTPTPVSPKPLLPVTSFIHEAESLSPFVGRDIELKSLAERFEEIGEHGRGKTILLSGDAGIGKTRLVHEALQEATAAGFTTLYGAAYEQEELLPYQPFVEAFDDYLARSGSPVAHNPITDFRKSGVSDPQQEQWALFNSTVKFVTELAKDAPVIFVVDDLDAADETSLRLFHFLARQTQSAPVALIATYRVDAASVIPSPFTTLLNALYREGLRESFELMRLSEAQIFHILEHVLGGSPDDALVKSVFDITEGNPFYVREIGDTLVKLNQVEQRNDSWSLKHGVDLSVPSGLSGLLRERVMRLGPTIVNIMTTAAVLGREFNFDILHKVVALSDNELLDGLDTALSAQLIEETGEGYKIRHALIRQSLYESLSKVRLARLHTYVAEAIETTYAGHPEGIAPHVEVLAFHYDHSDQRSRALGYLIRSGENAANVYAFEVAVNYFERALALMDVLRIVTPEKQWPVLEALGWWCIILADTPRAVGYFERALALPAHNGWQAGNRDRARLHRGAVMTLITAGNIEAAEDHLRQALSQINENEDAQEYAHTLYNVAQFHWHKGEHREAFETAQKSLAIAERLNDANAIARAFEMLALACHSLGEWQQGLTYEQQRWSALAGSTLDVTEAFDSHL